MSIESNIENKTTSTLISTKEKSNKLIKSLKNKKYYYIIPNYILKKINNLDISNLNDIESLDNWFKENKNLLVSKNEFYNLEKEYLIPSHFKRHIEAKNSFLEIDSNFLYDIVKNKKYKLLKKMEYPYLENQCVLPFSINKLSEDNINENNIILIDKIIRNGKNNLIKKSETKKLFDDNILPDHINNLKEKLNSLSDNDYFLLAEWFGIKRKLLINKDMLSSLRKKYILPYFFDKVANETEYIEEDYLQNIYDFINNNPHLFITKNEFNFLINTYKIPSEISDSFLSKDPCIKIEDIKILYEWKNEKNNFLIKKDEYKNLANKYILPKHIYQWVNSSIKPKINTLKHINENKNNFISKSNFLIKVFPINLFYLDKKSIYVHDTSEDNMENYEKFIKIYFSTFSLKEYSNLCIQEGIDFNKNIKENIVVDNIYGKLMNKYLNNCFGI